MTNLSNIQTSLTMSSREIAELTGKNHASVMRDIRNILGALGKDVSDYGGIYYDAYGREKPCFTLDHELALIMVSSYSVELRAKVMNIITHGLWLE